MSIESSTEVNSLCPNSTGLNAPRKIWRKWAQSHALKGSRLAVLMYLIERADKYGVSRPSRQTIADKVGYCVKTVQSSLNELDEKGLIERLNRYSSSKGYRLCNAYRIKHPSCVNSGPFDEHEMIKRGKHLSRVVSVRTNRQITRCKKCPTLLGLITNGTLVSPGGKWPSQPKDGGLTWLYASGSRLIPVSAREAGAIGRGTLPERVVECIEAPEDGLARQWDDAWFALIERAPEPDARELPELDPEAGCQLPTPVLDRPLPDTSDCFDQPFSGFEDDAAWGVPPSPICVAGGRLQ